MPTLQSPQDVLAVELRAIHSAEQQHSRSLLKLAKKVRPTGCTACLISAFSAAS
jgi:ferritin-like metal-binding protein YciE